MEFIIDILNIPSFRTQNVEELIPQNCTILRVENRLLERQPCRGSYDLLVGSTLGTFYFNESLKKIKDLQVLDLSGCKGIKDIHPGFSGLSITTLILPPDVSELPQVYYCPKLTRIIGKGLIDIRRVIGCPMLESIEFNANIRSISLPNTNIRKIDLSNLTEIESFSFENCSNLTEIKFSSKLSKIGFSAFKNCTNLYKVELPDHCVILGQAFCGCSSLKFVKLPSDLKVLECDVFSDCVNLREVEGGEQIDVVKKGAFFNCKSLTYLPFNSTKIDSESFECLSEDLIGIVLSTQSLSIIWCFNDLTFYYSPEQIDLRKKNKIVRFKSTYRFTLLSCKEGLEIKWNPCQLAAEATVINKQTLVKKIQANGPSVYTDMSEALMKYGKLPHALPKINDLFVETIKKIESLDITSIIDSYKTYAIETQFRKIGGDNTFYHSVKTSIDYSDAYIESLLPTVNEEYSESSCHDYSDEIDKDIQTKYALTDIERRHNAHLIYNKDIHINTNVYNYLNSYIHDSNDMEDVLFIRLAKKVLSYYMSYLYRHYDLIRSLSIICGGVTPSLDYRGWLHNRYKELYG